MGKKFLRGEERLRGRQMQRGVGMETQRSSGQADGGR